MDDFDLDDLLAEGPVQKKKAAKRSAQPKRGGKSALDDDFYSNLAAQAGNDADSEVSDADASQMARDIGGLDDMDADLFGGQLPKRKGSGKGSSGRSSKQTTPRRTRTPRSNSNTPRTASGANKPGSPQRVVSPTQNEGPTSPRGGKVKKTPSKPSSPPPPVTLPKPGTAPGKLSELYKESENLKPGQVKPENSRPSTTPKTKSKLDFGEFDEDDPLAGLDLSEEESVSQKKPSLKAAVKQQRSNDDVPVSPPAVTEITQQTKAPESPRRKGLFDRPPTRSGSGKSEPEDTTKTEPAKPKPAAKKKDEVIFSDEDDFLLGLEEKSEKSVDVSKSKPKSESLEESQRSAKSFMDGLLGKGSTSQTLDRPDKKTFVLDSKYSKAQEKQEEEDFLFGSYQPSAASGSRPGSRRSVRFQDDDLFGSDNTSSKERNQSPGGSAKKAADNFDWLDFPAEKAPPSPTKTSGKGSGSPRKSSDKPADSKPGENVTSPRKLPDKSADIKSADAKLKSSPADWLGLKDSESSEDEFFRPKRTPPPSQTGRRGHQAKPETIKEGPKDLPPSKMAEDSKSSTKQTDDYLGLGQEVNLDDLLITRPESPAFQGKSPTPFDKPETSAGDMFTPPPARDTRSGPMFDAQMKQTRPVVDGGINEGLTSGRRPGSSLRHQQSVDEVDFTPAPSRTAPHAQSQQVQHEITSYPAPTRELTETHLTGTVGKDTRGYGQEYSRTMQDFLEEPISQPNQRLQLQDHGHVQGQQNTQQPSHFQHQSVRSMEPQITGPIQTFQQTGPPNQFLASQPVYPTTVSGRMEALPASFEDAQARLRKLEIEKHYAESLLESTRKRYDEEISAIEASYKNRIKILEDSHIKKEARMREESEQLMSAHVDRVRKMEQEKADIASQNYKNLEDFERVKAQEIEKIKDQHRTALSEVKKEQEEMIERLKKAKNLEIEAVASAHDTSKSLTAVVEQIQNNAKDLGELQHKVDSWHRQGLDDREISLKSKDEQLRILQERLRRQEEDNENERKRLEDLISRMETQLREQTRVLDEERWKLKQDHARAEAQQKSLEDERRIWVEQQARERDMIERARSSFLEEQRSSMNQINEERRALAEERTKFNVDQKMMREKMNHDSIKAAQAEAEYEVLVKSIAEERAKSSQRLQELQREEDRMEAERTRLEREKFKMDAEKDRLSELAMQVKHKSAEVDSMSELASRSHREGEHALMEARQIESQQNHRLDEIGRQTQNIKNMEEHIAEEKLRLAKEKKDVENLKSSSLCANCRTPLRPGDPSANNMNLSVSVPPMMSPINGFHTPVNGPEMFHARSPGLNFSANSIESITSSIAADRSVRLWKIKALKDKEYLEEESMFLETLKHSPYHNSSQRI